MAELLLVSIVMMLLTFVNAVYDVGKYCQLIQPGTKLPSLDSCQAYHTCEGGKQVKKSYCPDNTVFDKDAQSCVPETESNCYYDVTNPCFNKHNQFTYCSNGCNWYNYCIDGEIAGNGTCDIGQRFYLANSSCIYGTCDDGNDQNVVDVCEIMPDGVFFGDFENCRGWHKCDTMNEIAGLCDDSLVFDVVSGYCLPNKDNMCQRTNNVVAGQPGGPPKNPCTNETQIVADESMCSIYYVCKLISQNPTDTYQWMQKSCKNQYFDVISKTCSSTLSARVYPGCDRCQLKTGYSATYWTNAVDPICEQYFTCHNGQKVGNTVRSCKEGWFFDESAQACVGTEDIFEQYVQNNGACQDYTCTDESRECSMVVKKTEASSQPNGDNPPQSANQKDTIPAPIKAVAAPESVTKTPDTKTGTATPPKLLYRNIKL